MSPATRRRRNSSPPLSYLPLSRWQCLSPVVKAETFLPLADENMNQLRPTGPLKFRLKNSNFDRTSALNVVAKSQNAPVTELHDIDLEEKDPVSPQPDCPPLEFMSRCLKQLTMATSYDNGGGCREK